ncbi:sce7726 family protein [Corallococcus silvisoli]|uniref:sce7726 family protein n=1 Tax=Corallococcus silvisoli TaxID=2697031 RepID=UPI001377AEEA|nr:sce7726 family protein [Corallococcus silvisoli]NBD11864.1 sce7726 family protein [Corallococcus silvisoli]
MACTARDRDIRPTLRQEVAQRSPGARVLDELGLAHGICRVDVASVTADCLHGYELKADRDTLTRLPAQVVRYSAVLDRCTLVVGDAHFQEALQVVPSWWGILRASVDLFGIRFEQVRNGQANPAPDALATSRLLWRGEALSMLEELGAATGVRSQPRNEVYRRLISVLPEEQLRARVRQVLLTRSAWRGS